MAEPAAAHAPASVPSNYALPLGELAAVAEAVGLQWVNSDSEKVRAVQVELANAGRPAHVPRTRKPTAAVDDGPLVLVETSKDLSRIKLPFDTP